MGQFCQVNTEILPFVLKIRFGALSFPIFSSISSNFEFESI